MMDTMPFTLRQLQIFASLCDTFSFRESSEVLGISQASVSSQLKALEDQLGLTLLSRSPGKRPELTVEGDAFLQDFRRFRQAAEALASHRETRADDGHLSCSVFIGCGLLDDFVRPKMDRFLIENQDITLSFEARLPGECSSDYIDSARFHFGLFHQSDDWPHTKNMRVLAQMKGGIYGHRKFLEADGSLPDAARLSDMPFILPEAGSTQERTLRRVLRERGIRPDRVICRTQYYDVIANMVARGLGIGCLVENQVSHTADSDIVLLREMRNWKLIWYAQPGHYDPRLDRVEKFLRSCVLDDADYPSTQ